MSDLSIPLDGPFKSQAEFLLAKKVGDYLNMKYPGHLWAVFVNQGLVIVQNMALSGKWGFVLKEDDCYNDMLSVMRAAGELLERYRVSRNPIRLQGAYQNVKYDFQGLPIGDLS